MTITVRLSQRLKTELRTESEATGVAISDFVREAIAEKLARVAADRAALVPSDEEVFGCIDSGRSDISKRADELVGEAIDEKHRRRKVARRVGIKVSDR